jgi:pimeloyl-ACP methyl ester carboxylesterase
MAKDVEAVADKLGLTRFVLVGHSLGGSVASVFAAAHPERVAGLVLVDGSGDLRKAPLEGMDAIIRTLHGPQAREYLERLARQSCGQTEQALREAREGFEQVQPDAAAAFVEGALHYDPAATLSRYPGPRLLVYGDKDSLPYTLQNVAPPDVQRLQIDAGHCLNLAAPARFDAALDEFLARIDAPAAHSVRGPQGALRVDPAFQTSLLALQRLIDEMLAGQS